MFININDYKLFVIWNVITIYSAMLPGVQETNSSSMNHIQPISIHKKLEENIRRHFWLRLCLQNLVYWLNMTVGAVSKYQYNALNVSCILLKGNAWKYIVLAPDNVVEFRANINILSSKSYCIPLAKINLVCNKNNNYTTSTKYFGRNKFKDALFTHDLIFREPNNHTTISICMDIHTERYTDAKTNVYSERGFN